MNCAQHPERPATAFCQNCGKSLCPECTRTADGLVLCEPCLLLRYPNAQASSPGAGWSAVPGGASFAGQPPASPYTAGHAQAPYTPVSPAQAYANSRPKPVLAGFLGLLFPGVGAMYNGQFVKALIHVVVFTVLVGAAQHFNVAGILIAAWVFYQAFDAAQTARARRDGLPLPDPFGILDLSRRIGPQGAAYAPPPVYAPPPMYAQPPAPPVPPAAGQAWTQPPPDPAYPVHATDPYRPVPAAPPLQAARRGEPVGALVLIAVGLLFLMSTLGLFDVDWIGRLWPVVLLLLGVWLLVRRARSPYPAPRGATPDTPSGATPSGQTRRSAFSIAPDPVTGPANEKEEPR